MLHTNITRNAAGHLCFAGFDTLELAKEFGTPAYLLDGLRLRDNCRKYTESMHRAFGPDSQPFYASKALCFAGIYPILDDKVPLEVAMQADFAAANVEKTVKNLHISQIFRTFAGSNK